MPVLVPVHSVCGSKVDHPFPLKRGRHEAHRLRVVCGSFPNPRCVIRCLISWASCLASWEGCAGDFIEARSSLVFHYLCVGMQVLAELAICDEADRVFPVLAPVAMPPFRSWERKGRGRSLLVSGPCPCPCPCPMAHALSDLLTSGEIM